MFGIIGLGIFLVPMMLIIRNIQSTIPRTVTDAVSIVMHSKHANMIRVLYYWMMALITA